MLSIQVWSPSLMKLRNIVSFNDSEHGMVLYCPRLKLITLAPHVEGQIGFQSSNSVRLIRLFTHNVFSSGHPPCTLRCCFLGKPILCIRTQPSPYSCLIPPPPTFQLLPFQINKYDKLLLSLIRFMLEAARGSSHPPCASPPSPKIGGLERARVVPPPPIIGDPARLWRRSLMTISPSFPWMYAFFCL